MKRIQEQTVPYKMNGCQLLVSELKSTHQIHPSQPDDAKAHSIPGSVSSGVSKPSGATLDRDLAQGYVVIAFVYVLMGALLVTFYILRQSSKRKK